MKYKVKWNYKSSLGGPWLKGDVVDLKEDMAEAINRDSPGVLEEVGSKTHLKENRMVAEAEFSRKAKANEKPPSTEGKQEPIDKTVFKAVKK
jgi:hypothetical protein